MFELRLTQFFFITSSIILISTLAYGSQVLFYFIEPGPLDGQDFWVFNILVVCIFTAYARACSVDPGDLSRVASLKQHVKDSAIEASAGDSPLEAQRKLARWCKKCNAAKPPRTHHCKVCKRCIPKMDHHCPWTTNCVSHTTFPHFMRFLSFSVVTMIKLASFQLTRVNLVWNSRHLPSYLGPTPLQLAALLVLCGLNAVTLFGMSIIFLRTAYCLGTNVTAIESWEIERHETLVRRAKKHGGYLDAPDGSKIRIRKQEFPYDIGIWSNICQGMGGGPLTWIFPLASTPSVDSGIRFEVNGFEDKETQWPPPDPDKMPRAPRMFDLQDIALELDDGSTDQERLDAFRERQEADLRRRAAAAKNWANAEGEKLEDFGVDDSSGEGDGSDNEDSLPLSELLQRKRAR